MTPHSSPRPIAILTWGIWFGILGGTLELVAFLSRCLYFSPRNFNVSHHFPWMYPASGLAVLAVPSLVLALFSHRVPTRLVLFVLAFPSYLGLLFRIPLLTVACLILASGVSYQTARLLAPRIDRFQRVVRLSLPPLLVAFLAAILAFNIHLPRKTISSPSKNQSNVLLIVLDTVRAQSLSLYGYPRQTSPNLTRYASRGVRFDLAFSTAPWTAPSHAGMFTGRHAHDLAIGWDRPLDPHTPTLAAHLGSQGYSTAGFVANTTYCSRETGLARGFDHYEDEVVTPWSILLCSSIVQRAVTFADKHPGFPRITPSHRKSAARINADFLHWLDAQPSTTPFFAFLNVYDAHHPYILPEYEPSPTFGPIPDVRHADLLLRGWWALDKRNLPRADLGLAVDAYDRCIAYIDHHLGKLLDDLDRRGTLANTLVVITADHGEHLGEQNLYGHGASLYRPELHVPLLILPPASVSPSTRLVSTPVSLRDLPATILSLLDPSSAHPFPGQSLASLWSSSPPLKTSPVLSTINALPEVDPNHGDSPARLGPMTSLVADGYHYVRNGDGREELYDLDLDPLETQNLAPSPDHAPRLSHLRSTLIR